MSIVMLIAGLIIGAFAASLVLLARARAERELREAAQTGHAAQLELLEASRKQLRDEMKGISADVLERTAATLAREVAAVRAGGRRAQRRRDDGAGGGAARARRADAREARAGRAADRAARPRAARVAGADGEMLRAIGDGLTGLRAETGNLVGALKRPATRGAWGEIQLRNVIEMAGMVGPLRLRRAGRRSSPATAGCGRTCWCGCRAAS